METWTIKRCRDWTIEYFERHGVERARLNAEWLLTSVCHMKRFDLYANSQKPMSPEELGLMHQAVVRRAKGEPLQYIAGETTFRMIDIACAPGVLIPRPETEVLVEEVLSYLDTEVLDGSRPRLRASLPWNGEVEAMRREEERAAAEERAKEETAGGPASDSDGSTVNIDEDTADEAPVGTDVDEFAVSEGAPEGCPEAAEGPQPASEPACARVLEVGCGTGCISLSLAHERPRRVTCVAIDIEPRAVELSCRNRDALGIAPETVDVRLGNLVSPLDRETEWGTFDVLVSNPPYIPTAVMGRLPHEVVDYEPHLALDGGADGLDIFRRLVRAAPHMLKVGGLLACELHETCLDAAAQICQQAGFDCIRIVRDLADRPRIILARMPEAVVEAAAVADGRRQQAPLTE